MTTCDLCRPKTHAKPTQAHTSAAPPNRTPASKQATRCRACSTAERTATDIVQAPIAHAHRAPRAPRSSCLCSPLLAPAPTAPCLCCLLSRCLLSHCLLSRCLLSLLLLPAPAPHAPAPAPCSLLLLSRSCSLCLQLPFRLWHCSQTFPSTTCARYSTFRLCFSALSLAPWTLPL